MTTPPEDTELLRRHARDGSEQAFAEIVSRHINQVYAGALRRVGGDRHLAEDVTQLVFTALAAAGTLTSRTVLAGWLHTTTRFQAAQVVRTERRRQAREQEVYAMNETFATDSSARADWEHLRPVIDGALDELGERDREAVLLRYFEGKSFAEVGSRVGLTENAARMRVERALERMHGMLTRRGVASTTGALALALAGEGAVIAPAGLVGTVTGVALATSTVGVGVTGGLTFFSIMSSSKIITSVTAVIAAVAAGVAFNQSAENSQLQGRMLAVQRDHAAVQSKLGETERALAAEKARARAAEDDAGALLAVVERVEAESASRSHTPITQESVLARYRHAQELVRGGNWEAALPELLWCYDEGMLRVAGFSGVRASFLLGELGRLAGRYPPALAALRERRDRAEEAMAASSDSQVALEFATLNRALGEDALTLAAFDSLPPGDLRRQGLADQVFDQLLGAQRYADAASAVPYSQMVTHFTRMTRDIPAPSGLNAETMKRGIQTHVITSAAKNIEVLAGAGRLEEARDFMSKLLAYDGSVETRLIVREHLVRAGQPNL